jgi:hypothetical protein
MPLSKNEGVEKQIRPYMQSRRQATSLYSILSKHYLTERVVLKIQH